MAVTESYAGKKSTPTLLATSLTYLAVAEHARADRPCVTDRLLPLDGIDVVGGHGGS